MDKEELNEVELINAQGEKATFKHVITVEYKGEYYAAFEPAEEIDGIEDGEFVVFKLHPDSGEMEFIDDEKLLDNVCDVIFEELDSDED